MTLKMDGQNKSLFSHNRDYDEGLKQRGIRPGQATVVVALDGSGDAETIQEGIDMLPTTGGEIYIKEGTYIIKNTIVVPSNTQIKGTGRGTIIEQLTATGVSSFDFINNSDTSGGNSKIILKDFRISMTGPNSTVTRIYGVYIENATECIINNVFFSATQRRFESYITFNNVDSSYIFNCLFVDGPHTDSASIELQESTKNIISTNIFEDLLASVGSGIIINSTSHNNTINGNILSFGAGTYGIDISGDRNIITNNKILGVTETNGINITATADRTLVVGNISLDNSGGNYGDAGTNTTATGNIIA